METDGAANFSITSGVVISPKTNSVGVGPSARQWDKNFNLLILNRIYEVIILKFISELKFILNRIYEVTLFFF